MSSELFDKWLAYYDPIHRGYTVTGIANAVTVTNGWSFGRISGGYNLYRGTNGSGSIDFSMPVGAAGSQVTSIGNFSWRPHAAGTSYCYAVKAVGGGGVESEASHPVNEAAFDAGGALKGVKPNSPSGLRVRSIDGGRFELRWTYPRRHAEGVPATFDVFHDAGTGVVDYQTVVGQVVSRRGRLFYEYTSGAFTHGTRLLWSVRAVTSDGADDGNASAVLGYADASAPPVHPEIVLSPLDPE